MQQFEVLIVGMGPVGLAAGNLLGQAGNRTRIIERNEGLSSAPKALFIDDEFFRLLSALGLEAPISKHAIYPVDFHYISPLGFRVGLVVGRITEHHFPNRAATYQPDFENILLDGLRRFPNVSIAFGEELTAFSERDDGMEAVVRRGEESMAYEVRYILAADGARSTCRRLLGIAYEEVVEYGDRHVVIDVDGDSDQSRIALTKLGWRRNFMSLPMPGGRRRFEFSVSDSDNDDDIVSDETLARLFRPYRRFEELKIIRKVLYSFRARLARQLGKGRVFLLGDAAHIMPVFGSQGMNSGARDANNIAWKLAAVLRGQAGARVLDTYHDERHAHAAQSVRIAVASGRLQAVRSPPVAILRDLVLACVNLVPSLRRAIREMRYIPRPVIKSRLVVGSAGSRTFVGRLLPNPEIETATGVLQRLDDLIGLNFALVGIAPVTPLPNLDHLTRRLGMQIVTVQRARSAAPSAASVIVKDGRFDEVFARHSGCWLIVRPDRAVAAVATDDSIAADLAAFVREIEKT